MKKEPKSNKIGRLFRFDMYPADWLIDTSDLTIEEQGMFLVVVLMIYSKRGPIPNDADELSRKFSKCSSRSARSIIDKLIQKDKLTLSGNFLSQKRAELELNTKRTHLERSANGGRTAAENKVRDKKIKDLPSTRNKIPVPTPSPSPNPSPSPSPIEDQDQRKPPPRKHTKTSQSGFSNFDVSDLMDDDGFMDARVYASALGQDVQNLIKTYNEAVRTGTLDPPRDANKAFPAWINSLVNKKQNRKNR